MKCVCSIVAIVLSINAAMAQTTYYVRPDGGTADQCTGLVDAAYPGSGQDQACAWSHPFIALPPDGTARLSGGDTLILGSGSYRMGYGAPGDGNCDQSYSWDCHMVAIPSGTAGQPTRILGQGWENGCPAPPELWGAERPWFIVNLTDSSHVELGCLEITDHESCIEDHNFNDEPCSGCTDRCERSTPPFGDWAPIGLYAEDAAAVHLFDLDIHGLASAGIHAGRLSDWTVERVRIVGNGFAGWDFDLWDENGDNNSGDLVFRELEVAYNGCGEDPDTGEIVMETCWGQTPGGYGDGFAPGASGGHWVLEDCSVHHNTSDGVDMLYLRDDSSVEVVRLYAGGNAGNQLKVAGPVEVTNSVLVGNCAFFSSSPLFQGDGLGDNCRAGGNALALDLHQGDAVTITNTTITGQGDCLVEVGCADGASGDDDPDCNGSESALLRNVLLSGEVDWFQPAELTCHYWQDSGTLPLDPVSFEHPLVYNCKNDPCPGGNAVCGQDPLFVNANLGQFDGHLNTGSPAIDAGTAAGAPADDFEGLIRDGFPDIGAYELGGCLFRDDFESGNLEAWSQSPSDGPVRSSPGAV